jgi:hypothetical protein
MWSRDFLRVGLWSAVGIAAATIALIWLVIFISFGAREPKSSMANISLPGIVGTVVYPMCWYLLVFRPRRYTRARAGLLVTVTYLASCVVVALPFAALTWQQFSSTTPNSSLLPLGFWVIGVILLAVPYAVVATPMAFVHRQFLLNCFAPPEPQSP